MQAQRRPSFDPLPSPPPARGREPERRSRGFGRQAEFHNAKRFVSHEHREPGPSRPPCRWQRSANPATAEEAAKPQRLSPHPWPQARRIMAVSRTWTLTMIRSLWLGGFFCGCWVSRPLPPTREPRRARLAMGSRKKSFCIVKIHLTPKVLATEVLAPAPGQGLRPDVFGSCGPNTPAAGPSHWLGAVCKTGWGGGRNSASAVPAFDPHPSLPPARGNPPNLSLTPCRQGVDEV